LPASRAVLGGAGVPRLQLAAGDALRKLKKPMRLIKAFNKKSGTRRMHGAAE
jgi:hypothetical protein